MTENELLAALDAHEARRRHLDRMADLPENAARLIANSPDPVKAEAEFRSMAQRTPQPRSQAEIEKRRATLIASGQSEGVAEYAANLVLPEY